MSKHRWDFSDSVPDVRSRYLIDPPPFSAIVDDIRDRMNILCCHGEPCVSERGFARVVFCIRVPGPLFDLFFNSGNGYRAGYYRSSKEGTGGNRLFIRTLMPSLLAWHEKWKGPHDTSVIQQSLKLPSAKVWLAEHPGLCHSCSGEWSAPQEISTSQIRNDRWELCRDDVRAQWGCAAPLLTKIRIFGAFLDSQNHEYVPAHKRDRTQHIFGYGWS